jgi:3-oxoacyl-[acyl-carrier-protein] synthase II
VPLVEPERVGVIVGVGIGGISSVEEAYLNVQTHGARRVSPFLIPRIIPNMASGQIAMRVGARGPNYATTSACASGAHAIGEALVLIRDGRQDVMLAGGAEAPVCLLAVGGFSSMRALATNFNDEPARASRPFDARRDGFVIAEGAGVLVLEELEHARRRGARIYAEVVGYGATCDAYHMTQPAPEGVGAAECMGRALDDADLSPADIGYINAHGTGTPFNDEAETLAVKRVFGEYAARVPVSSTKSMTGHLLGAAGSVEAALTVLALRDQVAPPTINLDASDVDDELRLIAHHALPMPMTHAMTNSFGFGGTNASLIFRHPSP